MPLPPAVIILREVFYFISFKFEDKILSFSVLMGAAFIVSFLQMLIEIFESKPGQIPICGTLTAQITFTYSSYIFTYALWLSLLRMSTYSPMLWGSIGHTTGYQKSASAFIEKPYNNYISPNTYLQIGCMAHHMLSNIN